MLRAVGAYGRRVSSLIYEVGDDGPMNSFYDQAGERIRRLRKQRRYTREQFAEIAGISSKFLYEIETGQKGFSADTLYRIAQGLSVSCEYILTGKSEKPLMEEMTENLRRFDANNLCQIVDILNSIHEMIDSRSSSVAK